MVHMCNTMTSPSAFFLFFQNFNFPGCYRGNRVKKGFCQEPPCILWLWFLVHMYQMMISPVLFQWDVISLRFLVHMYNMIFLSVFLYFLIFLIFQFHQWMPETKFWGVSHLHICVIFFLKYPIKGCHLLHDLYH